jgi:hypothetical protein
MATDKYTPGQQVTCNGNPQGRILRRYSGTMYEVRLFVGRRHVGDVVVSAGDLDLENPPPGGTIHPSRQGDTR